MKFHTYVTTLQQYLPEKSTRNASKLLKQCSTFAKQSRKSNIMIYSKLLKFQTSPKIHQPTTSQPAIIPSSLGAGLQIFHRLCTVALDFEISQSTEDSPTMPSSFLSTIIGLPCSFLVHEKGTKFTKEGIDQSADKV